jgi:hypothetical protein
VADYSARTVALGELRDSVGARRRYRYRPLKLPNEPIAPVAAGDANERNGAERSHCAERTCGARTP